MNKRTSTNEKKNLSQDNVFLHEQIDKLSMEAKLLKKQIESDRKFQAAEPAPKIEETIKLYFLSLKLDQRGLHHCQQPGNQHHGQLDRKEFVIVSNLMNIFQKNY